MHIYRIAALSLLITLPACSYLETIISQAGYSIKNSVSPKPSVYKHMLSRDTYFVFGKVESKLPVNDDEVAVIAITDVRGNTDVVDVNENVRVNSYYGLNLPEGNYTLLVVTDFDRDGYYNHREVIAKRQIIVSSSEHPDKVVDNYDIAVNARAETKTAAFKSVPTVVKPLLQDSLFYPEGSVRRLNDPLFSPQMSDLGLYSPAAFLEVAPLMFYALEEDLPYKIPVIFVHGIGGSARQFEQIVAGLDRSRFRPWFFYYPSGMDLDQLSALFYEIFLSGRVIPLEETPAVIVAHSMGGLVARAALNRKTGEARETLVAKLITIASPLGGHPAAASSHRAPVVLPSWRDLAPDSEFIGKLTQIPLPAGTQHHLIYAYNNQFPATSDRATDGVVPLANQLSVASRRQASTVTGVEDSHEGVLRNGEIIHLIDELCGQVLPSIPEEHLREFLKGGFEVKLGPHYTKREVYYLDNFGHFLRALAVGVVRPRNQIEEQFARVATAEVGPSTELETAWIKFQREFPQLVSGDK